MSGALKPEFVDSLTEEEKNKYGPALVDVKDYNPFDIEGNKERFTTFEYNPPIDGNADKVSGEQSDGTVVTTASDNFVNPYPKGSDKYKKLQKYHDDGYTITEKDGKIDIFKAGTSKWEKNTSKRGSGSGTPTDGKGVPIYSEDIEGQGDVVNESGMGRYRYGSLSEGSRDRMQKETGTASYGSSDIELEENQLDFQDRWGDVTETIEGFDYKAKRGTPQYKKQWTEFQTKAEAKRKEEALASGIPYVPYFKKKGSEGYVRGEDFDGQFGLHTFNTPRLDVDYTKEERYSMDLPDKPEDKKRIDLETKEGIPKRWWAQDENNLITLAALDDTLRTPFGVPIERQKIDYVLDDWASQVGANNSALKTTSDALTAAGGPQAL